MLQDIYVDPLTGMSNLFSLIDSDIDNICGETGTILFLDLINLSGVNNTYGKKMGDLYIKNSSQIIQILISTSGFKAYRVGGDEFLLILPNEKYDTNKLVSDINSEIKKKMRTFNVNNVGIHPASWQYTNKIASISTLIKQCNINLEKSRPANNNTYSNVPTWADHLIDKMLLRVKETLDLLKNAKSLALTDEISLLPNHRAAIICLKDLFMDYKALKKQFSLLFIDGDNLRKYNEYGYEHGNEMIKALGNMIKSYVREDDEVFRWLSGDEFLVLLRNTGKKEAYQIAERIRSFIEKETSNWECPITISVGVSCYPLDGVDLDTIIHKAEDSTSKAKKIGKNCVV